MPSLSNDDSIHGSFLHATLGEIVESAFDTLDSLALQSLFRDF